MKVRLVHPKHGEMDCHFESQKTECLRNGWKVKSETEITEQPKKRRGRPPKAE